MCEGRGRKKYLKVLKYRRQITSKTGYRCCSQPGELPSYCLLRTSILVLKKKLWQTHSQCLTLCIAGDGIVEGWIEDPRPQGGMEKGNGTLNIQLRK